jgi:hypothetical protein
MKANLTWQPISDDTHPCNNPGVAPYSEHAVIFLSGSSRGGDSRFDKVLWPTCQKIFYVSGKNPKRQRGPLYSEVITVMYSKVCTVAYQQISSIKATSSPTL